MAAPDLTGTEREHRDVRDLGWALLTAVLATWFVLVVVGATSESHTLSTDAAVVAAGVGVAEGVLSWWSPPAVRLSEAGLRVRRQALSWRFVPWHQVAGVDVAPEGSTRWSVLRLRNGRKVALRGMPPTAARQLAEALAPSPVTA